ncbi:retrovirus-related pol polyprotein from transposon TNT 1-94 [Tanacetum coccineum]
MACDVSWKSRLSKLNDENVLLKNQVDSIVQERENIKLKYQKLFNSIKATRAEHQQEVNELVENISQKTYAYGKLLCVTSLPTNISVQAKKILKSKDNTDRSKPVTSHSTPKSKKKQKKNANVITRGMYKIEKHESHTRDSKTNMNVSNSTGVGSSNSVRKPKSKDNKSKNKVLKNTNANSSSAYVRKTPSSIRIDSNKRETINSNECQSNASVIQLILWIIDSGCSKHMTGNLQLLRNFVGKFTGTVHFGNDDFVAMNGYGYYVQGNLMICHVYYVEGLGHNLFSVGQFCDGDLKVAFSSNTCYVWNLEGDDLLTDSRESNLYTISISDMAASSPMCLMSKATSTKSWLWYRMLSHLNFGSINHLTSNDLVDGLLKFKYDKDHLCSTCEQGKSKKASFPSKLVPSTESKLELIHMDLCRPMRVESINGKKYILVIIDDYSQYTWVYFLPSKDEAPDMIINFINQVQRTLKAQILKIRTENGTEFKMINCCLEVARAMLIFSKTLEFLWAEAIATACFTQNRSLVHTQYNKTPYELIRGRKPNVQYFHVFRSLCYLTNDRDDLGKMKLKADIAMASECNNSGPGLNCSNFQDSSEELNEIPSQQDLDNLFGPLYEEYFAPSTSKVLDNSAANTLDVEDTLSLSSIIVDDSDAP